MKLPIGIDASRSFNDKPTGTENYSDQIIRAIAKIDRERQLRLYCKGEKYAPLQSQFENTEFVPIFNQKLWSQIGLMRKTWIDRIGCLFIPAHVI